MGQPSKVYYINILTSKGSLAALQSSENSLCLNLPAIQIQVGEEKNKVFPQRKHNNVMCLSTNPRKSHFKESALTDRKTLDLATLKDYLLKAPGAKHNANRNSRLSPNNFLTDIIKKNHHILHFDRKSDYCKISGKPKIYISHLISKTPESSAILKPNIGIGKEATPLRKKSYNFPITIEEPNLRQFIEKERRDESNNTRKNTIALKFRKFEPKNKEFYSNIQELTRNAESYLPKLTHTLYSSKARNNLALSGNYLMIPSSIQRDSNISRKNRISYSIKLRNEEKGGNTKENENNIFAKAVDQEEWKPSPWTNAENVENQSCSSDNS